MYATGRRPFSQLIAQRVEWVLRIASDLDRGYNSIGMRAWFERPRVELGGGSPLAVLGNGWQPSDDAVADVGMLAARLRGPG